MRHANNKLELKKNIAVQNTGTVKVNFALMGESGENASLGWLHLN